MSWYPNTVAFAQYPKYKKKSKTQNLFWQNSFYSGHFLEILNQVRVKDKTFSHHYQGSIDFNTVNTTCHVGMYFLIHPLVWINGERMAVHCLELGCIGLYIPSDLEISLGPRDVPRASPSGHLSGLGKSLGRRGCTTQYIPPLGSVRIQYIRVKNVFDQQKKVYNLFEFFLNLFDLLLEGKHWSIGNISCFWILPIVPMYISYTNQR